jgi:hypothetical protein
VNTLTKRFPGQAVLHVRVGEDVHANLARAREAMEALQQGRRSKPHFAVGFAEVGQTTAQLARTLERDYKNVHADVAALSEWLAVQRDEDGRVSVPWAEIIVNMKLPAQLAA